MNNQPGKISTDAYIFRAAVIENIATMVITAIAIIVLAQILGFPHCFWPSMLLLNINTVKNCKGKDNVQTIESKSD